jgi:hypothetical protein
MKKDKFLTHEALDRTSICAGILETYLEGIGGLTKAENKVVQKAIDDLWKLYQKIGERHL